LFVDRSAALELVAPYGGVHVDLGAGDGRYVLRIARTQPGCFVIGVDACRENLGRSSHRAPSNALFVIATVLSLPTELAGMACQISIMFPWGSLLKGLLSADRALLDGVRMVSDADASLEVYLNAGALEEQGWELEHGAVRVRDVLREAGFIVDRPRPLDATALHRLPSTWAKRLAFGRDPRAITFAARRSGPMAAGCVEPTAS
jgi:16S rRNA (adenine(1408)-N(1))-methyltransferase